MVFKNHQTETEEQYFYATDNFEGTEAQWDVSPLIFAQTHPNPSLVKKDINAALKSVKTIDGQDGYICGSVVESKVIIPGQPRLSANIVFDDPKLETMYNEGKLALSSAFFCPNNPDGRLNGKVEPNHVLVFVQDDSNQPRDLGSGWWHNKVEDGNMVDSKMHGGPGSGRYPAGSGGNSSSGGKGGDEKLSAPERVRGQSTHAAREKASPGETIKTTPGDKLVRSPSNKEAQKLLDMNVGDEVSMKGLKWGTDETNNNPELGGMENGGGWDDGQRGLHQATIVMEDIPQEATVTRGTGAVERSQTFLTVAPSKYAIKDISKNVHVIPREVIPPNKWGSGGVVEEKKIYQYVITVAPVDSKTNKDEDVGDIEKFKSFVNKLWHKLTGDVDDSSRIDDERPPVNDQPIHSHGDGGDGMDPTIQKKIKELDAKVTALQNERDALAKTNKALEDEKADLSKVIDSIALEKEDKAWANLRDTKIPRGWLVGDKAEDTQRSEYKKDPVAYLNKIIEAKREDPKGEVGMPFTNQNDDGDDTAKMNTLLVKSNIPGRLH